MPPPTPLNGILVLDLTTFLSGPFATRTLADLGADVVKIEPPAGDSTRHTEPRQPTAFWMRLHRDRRSVVLDLKTPSGREVVLDLARRADVLVENFRPGVTDRLGLAPAALRAVNPRIVSCSITGFGPDGPAADQVAIDGPVQAVAGLLSEAAAFGLPTMPVPLPVADIAGASAATSGILAALFDRERTGTGTHVDVSLFEALLAWVNLDRRHSIAPPVTQVVRGSDGAALLVQTPLHFQDRLLDLLATVPGFADVAQDDRFRTLDALRANADAYADTLSRAFATRTRAEWLAALAERGIPSAPVNTVPEALRHPQLAHRSGYRDMPMGDGGDERVLLGPWRFDEARRHETRRPPALGEHTREVLHGLLGYDDTRIDALADAGAFGRKEGT